MTPAVGTRDDAAVADAAADADVVAAAAEEGEKAATPEYPAPCPSFLLGVFSGFDGEGGSESKEEDEGGDGGKYGR